MKKTLQEYHIDDTALHEWLPWGGLIHPAVVKNKDESLMGFLKYDKIAAEQIDLTVKFVNGWILWTERRHFNGETENILIIVWNPFINREQFAVNTLGGEKISREETAVYFFTVLDVIRRDLTAKMEIELLENEKVLWFLASTISMKKEAFDMPEIPLYLDVMLSADVDFQILPIQIKINQKFMAVITLPALEQYRRYVVETLFQHFKPYEYRFCRRMLLFGQEESQAELTRHTQSWCRHRLAMKKYIRKDMLQTLNGYCTNNFIFFSPDKDGLEKNVAHIRSIIETIGLPYVEEAKNYKDTWWGSLPGIFRANIMPPIRGISNIQEFLLPCESGRSQ